MKTLRLVFKSQSDKKSPKSRYSNLLLIALPLIFISIITFRVSAQDWTQVGSEIIGVESGDNAGYVVDMSADGQTIVIGAKGNDTGGEDAGAARIYDWNGTSWIQRGIDLIGTEAEDEFGHSVGLSDDGNIVAIGAKQDDDEEIKTGYARVYTWNATAWEQMGEDLVGDNPYDRSGNTISLSGDGHTVAIGARNGPHGEESGSIKVYGWDGSEWSMKGNKIVGDTLYVSLGFSLSLNDNGNTIAVGIPEAGNQQQGVAKVFYLSGDQWVQKGSDLLGDVAHDQFGFSISTSDDGNTVAIGARSHSTNGDREGQAKVYSYVGDHWVQKGGDILGQNDLEFLGWSLSLSGNGDVLAIGFPGTVTIDFEGGLRIFEWDGASWAQKGSDILGETPGGRSGWCLALNSTGSTVVMGAPWVAESGWGEGKVTVYFYGIVDVLEQGFGPAFRVYPNPFSDHINIIFGQHLKHVTLTVRNIAGQRMSSSIYTEVDKIRYNLIEPNGIYFLELKSDDGQPAVLKIAKGL